MKKITYLLLLLSITSFAQQKTINNYKYVIVPNKFEFVNKPDKYQTSSLTKFLFEKSGFTTFLSDEALPKDLSKNQCLALKAIVKDNSGMFTTKNIIELKDCNNNVVFTSAVGKSKLKEYKRSYHQAIRNAFKSVKRLNYTYVPLQEDVIATQSLKETKVEKTKKIELPPNRITIKKQDVKKASSILYAQPKPNGYQLINTKPEVIFELLNTNISNTYILKNRNGILYKNNNSWIAEYYENGNKIIKVIEVKF